MTLVILHEKFGIVDNGNMIRNVDFEAVGESMGQWCCSWNPFATNRPFIWVSFFVIIQIVVVLFCQQFSISVNKLKSSSCESLFS